MSARIGACRARRTRMIHAIALPRTTVDVRVRRIARSPALRGVGPALAPLFPVGLPIVYLPVAYATALWLRRVGARGGRAIVASAWLGWLVHRAAVAAFVRERPRRPGLRRRTDSFPSGHTTAITSLALTTACVLYRQGLLSRRPAVALGVVAPVAMGAYRVLDDEHWATDVMGGWLVGAAIALSCVAADAVSNPPRVRARAATPSAAFHRARRERATSPT